MSSALPGRVATMQPIATHMLCSVVCVVCVFVYVLRTLNEVNVRRARSVP